MPKPVTHDVHVKQLNEQIDRLQDLRAGDADHMARQREEIERLKNAVLGAQAEVERQRKDNQWLKQLVQHLSEVLLNRSRI